MVSGEAQPPDLRDHLVLHRVVDAIYESAARGKEVAVRL
jgi:hypothetical protein